MQVSWLWAWCAIVRCATGGFQRLLGSMRHVSSRWCRFSSGLRAGANFGRSPAHAYAQECQAQATSSENSKGRLPDRDVRPMKRYNTLAGGRAVMRSRAAVAATSKILTPGLTKIKLTLAMGSHLPSPQGGDQEGEHRGSAHVPGAFGVQSGTRGRCGSGDGRDGHSSVLSGNVVAQARACEAQPGRVRQWCDAR